MITCKSLQLVKEHIKDYSFILTSKPNKYNDVVYNKWAVGPCRHLCYTMFTFHNSFILSSYVSIYKIGQNMDWYIPNTHHWIVATTKRQMAFYSFWTATILCMHMFYRMLGHHLGHLGPEMSWSGKMYKLENRELNVWNFHYQMSHDLEFGAYL